MSVADQRADYTNKRLEELEVALKRHLGEDLSRVLHDDTCIYVVGSGGRGEMSAHSDVDSFVTRVGREASDEDDQRVRTAITDAFAELKLPEPSRAGVFLKMHTDASLCALMGSPDDDMHNTLTARMLLLLESRPLLGVPVYEKLLESVIATYWKNEGEHAADYMPYVLVNDIVRYWRIMLLNYEHKNAEKALEMISEQGHAERRLRSYKLRFSRCMMCFSFLVGLLGIAHEKGNVTKSDVLNLVRRTPRARLEELGIVIVAPAVAKLLGLYDRFLTESDYSKVELVKRFSDKEFAKERGKEGRQFGDKMFALLQSLGAGPRARDLFRYMVV